MNLSSPVTGVAITGLTSPTYTLTSVVTNITNALAWIISALGGTQTGVDTNSIDNQFTLLLQGPKTVKMEPNGLAAISGYVQNCPKNEYTFRIKKGVDVNSLGAVADAEFICTMRLPVVGVTLDTVNVKALMSCFFGCLVQDLDAMLETFESGTV